MGAEAVAGLVSPVWCAGCLAEDVLLCTDCAAELRRALRRPFRAEQAALALPIVPRRGSTRDQERLEVLPVMAAGRYAGLLSRLIVGYKDHERIGLGRLFAPGMGRAVRQALESFAPELGPEPADESGRGPGRGRGRGRGRAAEVLLLRPPTRLRSRLRRSMEPVDLILAQAGLRTAPGLVCRTWHIGPGGAAQKTRGLSSRRSSVRGSLKATARGRRVLDGADVLLVDDVLTTGATLAALHTAAVAAGARVRGAAVLAAAPRPVSQAARTF